MRAHGLLRKVRPRWAKQQRKKEGKIENTTPASPAESDPS